MKPIERISMYLKFKNITPHSFEKKIHLSNGYFSKQLRNQGSVGSDILIKINEAYIDLDILWILTGRGQMILDEYFLTTGPHAANIDDFSKSYLQGQGKVKVLEDDLEKMNFALKDKDKIISLYEFMLNNNHGPSTDVPVTENES